ncbi:hypothetical protein TVAG_186190 [Trichomonas vaginalis G3]|uniref:TOG domain-containing protein n=1 Tax=Trichomonas vaginalis (strain ATCC PRA-98 / G3) TaxID=412133 RepID=A2D8R2_TRIV3|nr:armadillo (ARM) repeat-containing protein family [Trichomonas vaginalis G3]EAY23311.1 hypothetical protein TVAG_186190 [Trichomonas vaginalis G3]KAI5534036.1 armadillo (ARM) repeat-containing protein family [Trichomonas vaginalis G3]|eukprot:XP_001584297.1 hypothetical protein [Trichomonas vaginalis G3]
MSKITIKAQSLQKIKPDSIPKTVDELIKDIGTANLSEDEIEILCSAALPLIEAPLPATGRAGFKLCNVLFEIGTPNSFKEQLLNKLKVPLSIKGPTSELAIELSQKLIHEITPVTFFDKYIKQIPKSKTPILKHSVLKIFLYAINTFPEFKTKQFLEVILNCTTDNNPDVRKTALEIIGIVYNRNPNSMTKFIKTHFPNNFTEIIAKLAGKTPQKTETFADLSTVVDLTPEEIEKQTIQEFRNPLPNIQPDKRPCPFEIINNQLSRDVDWSIRMENLTKLVSHARGFADKRQYASDFRKADNFINCVLDARSTLAKHAFLCLAAIARAIGPPFDINTANLVTGIFSRTNHSALIISLSAELCILKYVEFVWGKNIKSVILNCCNVESAHSRLTAAKAMIIAAEKWPQDLTKDFPLNLRKMTKDKSDLVRDFISKQLTETGEIIYLNYCQSNEEEIKVSTNVEIKEHTETNKLSSYIQHKDIENIVTLLETEDIDVSDLIQNLSDFVIVEMNEAQDEEISIRYMTVLINKYAALFKPKIQEFINELPDDQNRGLKYIDILSSKYGKLEIMKYLMNSTLIYSHRYCAEVALSLPLDPELSSKVVKNIIICGFSKSLESELKRLMKNIYSCSKIAAEALIGSIPVNTRQDFLDTICNDIPFLKNTFVEQKTSDLVLKLKLMIGVNDIDQIILQKALEQNDSIEEKLLAIAVIRSHPTFLDFFVPFLLNCINDNENPVVCGAASNAFHKRCDGNDGVCIYFAKELKQDKNQLNAFAKSIVCAKQEEANESIHIACEVIKNSLSMFKFSALTCIAASIAKLGEDSAKIFGEFEENDIKLIQSLLSTVSKNSIV